MKFTSLSLLASVAVLGMMFSSIAKAESLIITTEEYPPLNFTKNGKITGSSTDLLREALKDTGIDGKITVYPWARAIDMAEKKQTHVYILQRGPKRASQKFKWAGPLVHNNWILLGRPDSPKIKSLDEAKKYTIGGYKNDALTNHLKALGMNVEEASADSLNAKKLRAKRIDFWGAYNLEGADITKRKGYGGLVKILDIKTVSMYLACNKGVADATIDKLNATFKKYESEGKLKAALAKYQ